MFGTVKFSVYPKIAKVLKNCGKENVKVIEKTVLKKRSESFMYNTTRLKI